MKKIFKLLALTVISIALINLTGCKKKSSSTVTPETETETPTIETTFDKGTSDSATFN
jgi:hypothetical protein